MREESWDSRDDGGDGERRSRDIREFKEFREFREALSTFIHKAQPLILSLNSLFSLSSLFSLCPCSPQSAHTFSREGLQMQRSAKIPTMGCTLAYCSLSGLFLLAAADAPLSREIIFLSEGVRFGLSQK